MDVQEAVRVIRKNLFPSGVKVDWHADHTIVELNNLRNALTVLEGEEYDLTEKKQRQQLRFLADVMKKHLYGYTLGGPADDPDQVNKWLIQSAGWFEKRMEDAKHSPLMCSYFRRFDHLYTKLFLWGGRYSLKIKSTYNLPSGPLIIASTHYYGDEPHILQTLTERHIFWVGDPIMPIPFTHRFFHLYNIPGYRKLMESIGIVEIRRDKLLQNLEGNTTGYSVRKPLLEVVNLLDRGEIIGIFPDMGGLKHEKEHFADLGNSFAVASVKLAQKRLGTQIPIIPMGVRRDTENKVLIINVGQPFYVSDKDDKDTKSDQLVELINQLAA